MLLAYHLKGHTFFFREGDNDKIRLLNIPSQYPIVQNYRRQIPMEVCSFNILGDGVETPDQLFDRLRSPELAQIPPAHGGWRELSVAESAALFLGTKAILDPSQIDPEVRQALTDHPAFRSGLGFAFGGMIPLAVVNLMGMIFDIRRFVDPARPGRGSNIKMYFRLNNPDMLGRFINAGTADRATFKPAAVVAAWYVHPFQNVCPDIISKNPNAFLFRELHDNFARFKSSHNDSMAHILSMWRVSVRFLTFIRMLWSAGLEDRPFDPGKFFRHPDEAESFHNFINRTDFPIDNFPAPM